jgi:hypothetical protein
MEILSNVEAVIGIEEALSCLVAFSVAIVPPDIPLRGRGKGIIPEIIGDISYYKLCFWYSVPLEILKIVVE